MSDDERPIDSRSGREFSDETGITQGDRMYDWRNKAKVERELAGEIQKLFEAKTDDGGLEYKFEARKAQRVMLERCRGNIESVVVAHRRMGKTLGGGIWMFDQINNVNISKRVKLSPPQGGFIGITATQAVRTIGPVFEMIASIVPGVKWTQSKRRLEIEHNGGVIQVCGAYDRQSLRGEGWDRIWQDEYAYHSSYVDEMVIRPAMNYDEGAMMVKTSTPNGLNHFYDAFMDAQQDPRKGWCFLPNSLTGVLPAPLVEDMKRRDPYAHRQEIECDFKAPIPGCFFGFQIELAQKENRIRPLPHLPGVRVYTAWDLGMRDDTAIWFVQVSDGGKSLHVIDHEIASGRSINEWGKILQNKPYTYGEHILPWDGNHQDYADGKTRADVLRALNIGGVRVVPRQPVDDGIEAVRNILPVCYFDEDKCHKGIASLALYRRLYDDTLRAFKNKPHHDEHSHSADAFRALANFFDGKLGTGGLKPEIYDKDRDRVERNRKILMGELNRGRPATGSENMGPEDIIF